jgi:hypothetical protein
MIPTFTPERVLEQAPHFSPPAPALPTPAPLVSAEEQSGPIICPHCGGSGILRMGDQQFRTCLECLGQGQLSRSVQQELRFPPQGVRVSAGRAG